MNETVRKVVSGSLAQHGMSRADLARKMGKTPQEITRALNGGKNGGSVPPIWQNILETLDLELTAVPRAGEHG